MCSCGSSQATIWLWPHLNKIFVEKNISVTLLSWLLYFLASFTFLFYLSVCSRILFLFLWNSLETCYVCMKFGVTIWMKSVEYGGLRVESSKRTLRSRGNEISSSLHVWLFLFNPEDFFNWKRVSRRSQFWRQNVTYETKRMLFCLSHRLNWVVAKQISFQISFQ